VCSVVCIVWQCAAAVLAPAVVALASGSNKAHDGSIVGTFALLNSYNVAVSSVSVVSRSGTCAAILNR
jgi:hypothetical protein